MTRHADRLTILLPLLVGATVFTVVPSISRGNGVSPPTLLTLLFCRGDGVGDTILRPLLIGGNIEWHPHSMFPAIHEGGGATPHPLL